MRHVQDEQGKDGCAIEPILNWRGEVVGYRRVDQELAIDATRDASIIDSKGEEGET